ncbi:MAG: prepilin peptidase [Chromatiales bacterium]|nr:prepilin peptidase [Chromatiales bacterium]
MIDTAVLQSAPFLLVGLATLLGLLVGSFLNVVIYRLPVMMERAWRRESEALLVPAGGSAAVAAEPFDLVRPRSACPACKAPIKARHNVPVLGWLWLRGRCAACGAPISARYPVVEALTGLVSGFLVWQFGYTPDALGALVLTWSLIALTMIDLDHQLLPDSITLPLLWAGLLFHLVAGPRPDTSPFAAGLADGVIGAMAGYLSLWLVYHGFRLVTGKEGMGYGDFKLFAALLAWLGYQMFLPILLLSALTGAVTGVALIALGRHARQEPIPFGPYLAAAGFVALAWGEPLLTAVPFLRIFP